MQLRKTLAALAFAFANACSNQAALQSPGRAAVLDAIAEQAVAQGFPGVVIATSKVGDDIMTGAAGFSDRASGAPMTPDARIHAASTTKAVTAAAALMLVDRGELALDATLPEVLPERIATLAPYSDRITVRDLLLHTSGIYSPNNDPTYLARYIGPERLTKPFWSSEEIVAFAASPENAPLFEPGAGQAYGDINYVLLSMIVAEASSREFKDFVRSEIFSPLHMSDSYFLSDDAAAPRARAYSVDSEILRTIGLDPKLAADDEGFVDTTDAQEQSDGAAGIITTAADLARFADGVLRSDLLSDASRDFLLAVADEATAGEEALGVLRAYRQPYGVIVTAEGDGPGTNVVWAMHMETKEIAVVATNLFGRWDESDYIFDVMLSAIFGQD